MNEAQKRAYRIADNKIATNAGWDENLLAIEFAFITSIESDVDIDTTGFSIAEVDIIIESVAPAEPDDPKDDLLPGPKVNGPNVYLGDIWQLGDHRLICGDALDPDVVGGLMDGATAHMIFTDPPYNVKIEGNVGGLGKIKHPEFAMASGEMDRDVYRGFLTTLCRNQAAVSKDGSIHFICMDWRHLLELQLAGEDVYTELKNVNIWVKDNGGMGTFYRSRHELIFVFKHGIAPHTNTFELGQHGRYRTNVWEYKGMNSRGGGRDELVRLHPTVKPVQMIADAIRDVSGRREIVLDLFAGSGSTIIAAHKTGRRAYAAELEPNYCSIIIARWEAFAKDEAVLLHRDSSADSESDFLNSIGKTDEKTA
jgi:DNA modification methylase